MTEQELYNEYRKSDFKSFTDFLINKNAQLHADYEKQKEINKELVDDIAELHKRIRELEKQIKQMNEQEARDIRTRFPC